MNNFAKLDTNKKKKTLGPPNVIFPVKMTSGVKMRVREGSKKWKTAVQWQSGSAVLTSPTF